MARKKRHPGAPGPPIFGSQIQTKSADGHPRRVSQAPVEVVISPTTGKGRFSQAPVESIISPTDTEARFSQAPVEVLIRVNPPLRFSQAPVEVIIRNVLTEEHQVRFVDIGKSNG